MRNLILIFFFLSINIGIVAEKKETLFFLIHPYLPSTEIIKKFTPLKEFLEKKTGFSIQIKISKNYSHHIENIGSNKFGIAYMGPSSYVKLTQKYKPKPILARLEVHHKPYFRGVLFTKRGSKILKLEDLNNKSIAFGDPNSTMSHLVPRYVLLKNKIQIGKYDFLKNHNNVVLSVLIGKYDAGAIKEAVFKKYESRGIRVLAYTPEIPEHLIVCNPNLNYDRLKQLKEALLSIKEAAILTTIKPGLTGFVEAEDRDYDILRKIMKTLNQAGINYG